MTDALMEREERAIAKVDTNDFEAAFDAYIRLQGAIDKRMPDQIMKIGPKMFRKKGYWRAVAKGFGLSLELVKEEFFEHGTDWGYRVIYTARDANGVVATGDGTCTKSEKEKGRMVATHHNVCSHAHTRAQNRAISNLVGFGEVSADELPAEGFNDRPAQKRSEAPKSDNWDGSQEVFFGKYSKPPEGPKKWSELPEKYLVWITENMDATKGPAVSMAVAEIGRRAKAEAEEPIEGEVVDEMPSERYTQGAFDMGPPEDDPRFR